VAKYKPRRALIEDEDTPRTEERRFRRPRRSDPAPTAEPAVAPATPAEPAAEDPVPEDRAQEDRTPADQAPTDQAPADQAPADRGQGDTEQTLPQQAVLWPPVDRNSAGPTLPQPVADRTAPEQNHTEQDDTGQDDSEQTLPLQAVVDPGGAGPVSSQVGVDRLGPGSDESPLEQTAETRLLARTVRRAEAGHARHVIKDDEDYEAEERAARAEPDRGSSRVWRAGRATLVLVTITAVLIILALLALAYLLYLDQRPVLLIGGMVALALALLGYVWRMAWHPRMVATESG